MVRTKTNFKPLTCRVGGVGKTLNEPLMDGSVVANSFSEKLTLSTLSKMDKLEQATPFQVDQIPPELLDKE